MNTNTSNNDKSSGKLPADAPKTQTRNSNTDENVERVYQQEEGITREDPEFTNKDIADEERGLGDKDEHR